MVQTLKVSSFLLFTVRPWRREGWEEVPHSFSEDQEQFENMFGIIYTTQ
jgi:hypothetical protein